MGSAAMVGVGTAGDITGAGSGRLVGCRNVVLLPRMAWYPDVCVMRNGVSAAVRCWP